MMFTDISETKAISSLGWVDGGAIWHYDSRSNQTETFEIGDAKYVSLHPGENDFFAALHNYDGTQVHITAHNFAQVDEVLSRAVVQRGASYIQGELDTWRHLPTTYAAYAPVADTEEYVLLQVRPDDGIVHTQELDWYDENYDKGYQGIIGVSEIPGTELVVISVQRDSRPVLYDPKAGRKVGNIELAGRQGNPSFCFRSSGKEVWVDDYDVLLKLELPSWEILWSGNLQEASNGVRQFIGQFTFDQSEEICAVARPFSNDVIALDPENCELLGRCAFDAQPLELAVLTDRQFLARDWKTGTPLLGSLTE